MSLLSFRLYSLHKPAGLELASGSETWNYQEVLCHCRLSLPYYNPTTKPPIPPPPIVLWSWPNSVLVFNYTYGWRERLWGESVLPKNTTQCPQSVNKLTSSLLSPKPIWHHNFMHNLALLTHQWNLICFSSLLNWNNCYKTRMSNVPECLHCTYINGK